MPSHRSKVARDLGPVYLNDSSDGPDEHEQDAGVMLSVDTITDESAFARLVPEWEELEAGIQPSVPFRSALWQICWWKHFRDNSSTVRDELRISVVRNAGGRLVGIAPMMLTRRPGSPPYFVRQLQFFGSDPYVTEVRGPVCRPQDEASVVSALSREFASRQLEWDWIQWSGIHSDSGAREVLDRQGGMTWGDSIEEFHLSLPSTWGEFKASLSRNAKEALRKCYNSLKRDGHVFSFRVVTDPSDSIDALNRFFDLHAIRAQARGMIPHNDVFKSDVAKKFLLDYGHGMAQRGGLCVFQLLIGDCIVATRVGFRTSDSVFLYFSGYLPEWAKYSVMTTVVAEALQWCIHQKIGSVHLSTGRDLAKLRWSPTVTRRDSGIQLTPGWKSSVRLRLFQAVKARSRGGTLISRLLSRLRRNNLGDT